MSSGASSHPEAIAMFAVVVAFATAAGPFLSMRSIKPFPTIETCVAFLDTQAEGYAATAALIAVRIGQEVSVSAVCQSAAEGVPT